MCSDVLIRITVLKEETGRPQLFTKVTCYAFTVCVQLTFCYEICNVSILIGKTNHNIYSIEKKGVKALKTIQVLNRMHFMPHPHSKNGVKDTNFIVLPLLVCLQLHRAVAIFAFSFSGGGIHVLLTYYYLLFLKEENFMFA